MDDICARATRKIWILVRFKNLGATQSQLRTVYIARIRSTLEFAAPVFAGALTKTQSFQIELVQKKAFAVILSCQYHNYENALMLLNLDKLAERRKTLSLNFALKCVNSSKHCWMFPKNPHLRATSRHPKPFLERQCNTSRHFNSPIPYLTRLLSQP